MGGWRLGLVAAAVAGGCGHLDAIPSNQCGNGVVEPDNGEDCDGEHGCGKPNTPTECRFECSETAPCPAGRGFGCGVDGVCRAPKHAFQALGRESTATTVDFLTGDTNKDGCHEVVRTTLHGTIVTALASKAPGYCAASEQTVPLHPLPPTVTPQYPSPVITELTGNERPELLIPGGGLVGASQSQGSGPGNDLNGALFVHTSDTNPSFPLVPELYTSGEQFPETAVRILKVNAAGNDRLLLFLGASKGATTMLPQRKCPADAGPATTLTGSMRVAALDTAASRSRNLLSSLTGMVEDIAAVKAGDLNQDGCDEVVVALAGTTSLQVYSTCDSNKNLAFIPYKTSTIQLDKGVRVRSFNSSLAIARVDADAYPDVLVLADDCQIHVAYGWPNGDFGPNPPGMGTATGMTGPLQATDPMISQMLMNTDAIFVAGAFDTNHPGQSQVAAVTCPGGQPFSSDVCAASPGDCEAVVLDIDRDGYDDIVTTQGQQIGLIVGRADPGGGFHQSSLDTECPPHHLTTGDFDDDGIEDVAFLDQISTVDEHPSTALKIAFGRAYATPEAPKLVGIFPSAVDLVSGQFVKPPGDQPVSRTQLFAARTFGATDPTSSDVGLFASDSNREDLAPLLVPLLTTSGNGASSLAKVDLVAVADGHFLADDPAAHAVALIAQAGDGSNSLWLFHRDPADGHVAATRSQLQTLDCTNCLLIAADLDGDKIDELVQLGNKSITIYAAGPDGFTVKSGPTTIDYAFQSILGDQGGSMMSGIDTRDHTPRPIVGSLDVAPEGSTDPVDIIVRDTDGDLIAFWGKGDGTLEKPQKLLAAPACGMSKCVQPSAAPIRIDDAAEPVIVVASPGNVTFYALEMRSLVEITDKDRKPVVADGDTPKADTDYVAIGAADLDGDGVDDLVIMPTSSSIHFLRGTPVLE